MAATIFNGNFIKTLKSALRVGSLSADPTGAQAGDLYYNSSAGAFKYHNGSAWNVFSGSYGTGFLTTTKTANYSASAWDFVLCSSAAFTVTLPTAVGITGAQITIKKTDSSTSNIISIATTSSQTIDGASSSSLRSADDSLTVVSDGSNWQIVNSRIIVAASYWCSANRSTDTSTPVNYDSKEYDTHNAVTTGASWKFTAPSRGFYQVSLAAHAGNVVSFGLLIFKAGVVYKSLAFNNSSTSTVNGAADIYLNSGDQIDIRTSTACVLSGGTLATANVANINIKRVQI